MEIFLDLVREKREKVTEITLSFKCFSGQVLCGFQTL